MKTLLLMRHAKSSWKDGELDDHSRPLNKRGKHDAPRVGRRLAERQLVPELIISSTAKRARKTAELVADAAGYRRAIQVAPEFYHAGADAYLQVLRETVQNEEVVLIIGHNPMVETLLEALIRERLEMPTAAMAGLEIEIDDWMSISPDVPIQLDFLWKPREHSESD